MEKLLEALAERQAYMESGERNSEKQMQLEEIVEVAVDEFIELAAEDAQPAALERHGRAGMERHNPRHALFYLSWQ